MTSIRAKQPRSSTTPNDRQRAAVLRWLRGAAVEDIARDESVGPETLKRWTRAYFNAKQPLGGAKVEETIGSVGSTVTIRRDTWGIAHVTAESETDAFFGLGYAMAQDRLWQLDFRRRFVRGELAAILGRRFLENDRETRILGIGRLGDEAWATASPQVRSNLEALAAGIDRWTAQVGSRLPVEFELLGYSPRPWSPADSIAIWKHRWWTLTGRLDQSVVDDVAHRTLPPELVEAFLGIELADETIVLPGESTVHDALWPSPDGPGGGAIDEGSNNWVVGGSHTETGAPVLCSDPHNDLAAPSQWFEAQVTCPAFDAAGAWYLGTPALYLGRNRDVAWGLTNHMISVRDLYVEETRGEPPTEYREGDTWQKFGIEHQTIEIAGEPSVMLEIRSTTRGPIVNALLPAPANDPAEPISLRWIAAEVPSGFDAAFGLLRATSSADIRDTLREWPCPPLNYVYGDRSGDIGYHAAGLVPVRERPGLGFRRANNPPDAWNGFWPFDDLPNVANPPRDWVATANNVPWSRNDWYLTSGAWSDGYRHQRIRERLTAKDVLSLDEIAAVHGDIRSVRGRDLVPALLDLLGEPGGTVAGSAIQALRRWNYDLSVGSVGASIWATFWVEWCVRLARARFPDNLVTVAANKVGGVGRRLILGEELSWFPNSDADDEIRAAFTSALDKLTQWGGPDVATWRWGRLHQITHPHPMSSTPRLGEIYDTGPFPTSGGPPTVRAASYGLKLPFAVTGSSTYRFQADLSRPDGMRSVQTLGQSAHLGSPHYRDQTKLWLEDRYHPFWMNEADVLANLESETTIRARPT